MHDQWSLSYCPYKGLPEFLSAGDKDTPIILFLLDGFLIAGTIAFFVIKPPCDNYVDVQFLGHNRPPLNQFVTGPDYHPWQPSVFPPHPSSSTYFTRPPPIAYFTTHPTENTYLWNPPPNFPFTPSPVTHVSTGPIPPTLSYPHSPVAYTPHTASSLGEFNQSKGNMENAEDRFSNKNFQCGVQQIKPSLRLARIAGGYDAVQHSWPWIALVGYAKRSRDYYIKVCGGTIVSPRHVITAHHCFEHQHLRKYAVYLGAHHRRHSSGDQYKVVKIRHHPRASMTNGVRYDMTVLSLTREIRFSSEKQPACLPSVNKMPRIGMRCWAYGWGNTAHHGSLSQTLRQVGVKIISESECKSAFQREGKRNTSMLAKQIAFCAFTRGKDTCQGDSGGPLTCREGAKWIVYGITSWGWNCGGNAPGVYASISYSMKWFCCFMSAIPSCRRVLCSTYS